MIRGPPPWPMYLKVGKNCAHSSNHTIISVCMYMHFFFGCFPTKAGDCPHLMSLDLGTNGITEIGAIALGEALEVGIDGWDACMCV